MNMICTPNNPTGPVISTHTRRSFLERVPADVLVAIDAAYLEFVRRDDVDDYLELYRDFPNVAVLRTFSKAHGLANMRVGYSVASEQVSKPLKVVLPAFATSTVWVESEHDTLN